MEIGEILLSRKGHEVVLVGFDRNGRMRLQHRNRLLRGTMLGNTFPPSSLEDGTFSTTGRKAEMKEAEVAKGKKGEPKKKALPRAETKVIAIRISRKLGESLKKHLAEKKVTLQDFLQGVIEKAVGAEASS